MAEHNVRQFVENKNITAFQPSASRHPFEMDQEALAATASIASLEEIGLLSRPAPRENSPPINGSTVGSPKKE